MQGGTYRAQGKGTPENDKTDGRPFSFPGSIAEVDAGGCLPCGGGRQGGVRGELLLGSHAVCRDSSHLFVPFSSSLCLNHGSSLGGFCVGPVAGMDTPVLLLASNFGTLNFPRPGPCFEREASVFSPTLGSFVSCCFYDKTPAQVFKSQMPCLWREGRILSKQILGLFLTDLHVQ
nr:LOW QUALITY PROTEIN: colorectal cancer-associated protein 1 [Microcebus murinus]